MPDIHTGSHKAVNPPHFQSILAGILLPMLIACSPQTAQSSNYQPATPVLKAAESGNMRTGTSKTFTSIRYGVRIHYPATLELQRTFKRSYLGNDGWKAYLGPDSPPGKPLVALLLPGSNSITAGELRLGVSQQPDAIRTCTDLPAAAILDTQEQITISGVAFTTFKARDAAMNHYLVMQSYRAVHCGTCYAMDVLVFGTHPEVYTPPVKAPFTKTQAFARLLPVAHHLQFIAEPAHATPSPIALPATYSGQLPCADCPGIDYQLNLLTEHHYHLRLNYQDRHAQFDEQGRWHLSNDAKSLVLQDQSPSIQQWAVLDGGQRLRLLNSSGHPIHSELNYDLTRRVHFAPLVSAKQGKKKAAEDHYEQRSRCCPADK